MAFYTWIDVPVAGTNVLSEANYSSDGQRTSGFSAGTLASSTRVNTALRQSTLVTKALMDALGLDTTCSYMDDDATLLANLTNALTNKVLTTVQVNVSTIGTDPVLTSIQHGAIKYRIPSGTSVIANPTLSGDETELSGLQVGSTKYSNHKVVATTLWSGSQMASTGANITLSEYVANFDTIEVYITSGTNPVSCSMGKCYCSIYDTHMVVNALDSTWNETQIKIDFLYNNLNVMQGASMFNITKVIGYKFF